MSARGGGAGEPIWRMALGLITVLIWSACFVVIKASQASAPPLLFAALRALVAGVPLLGVAASKGKLRPPTGHWAWIGALGLTNTTLTPVFALGLALPIYRERLSAPSLAGVAATAAGVMWVSWRRAEAGEAPGRRLGAR